MKKITDIITILIFFCFISVISIGIFFFGDSGFSYEMDNNPESAKSYISNYMANNAPLSSYWENFYTQLQVFLGKEQFDDVYIVNDRLIYVNQSQESNVNANMEYINDFSKKVNSPVYVMAVPSAAGVYSNLIPNYAIKWDEKSTIDNFYLGLNSNIETIDAYYPLYSARDEYIYYRTENMWTSFGAYCVYEEAIKKLGFEPFTMENYDQEYAVSSFTGSLYEKARYKNVVPDRINLFRSKYESPISSVKLTKNEQILEANSVYFKSALSTDKKTDIFLQGDNFEKITINTNSGNNSKILILKGSHTNTFVPFLAPHYCEITLVDLSKLEEKDSHLSDIVNLNDYDQILFLYDINEIYNGGYFNILY